MRFFGGGLGGGGRGGGAATRGGLTEKRREGGFQMRNESAIVKYKVSIRHQMKDSKSRLIA